MQPGDALLGVGPCVGEGGGDAADLDRGAVGSMPAPPFVDVLSRALLRPGDTEADLALRLARVSAAAADRDHQLVRHPRAGPGRHVDFFAGNERWPVGAAYPCC